MALKPGMKVGTCEVTAASGAMKIPEVPIGRIPPDPVAPDSLRGVSRQQINPRRWRGEGWNGFRDALRQEGVEIRESRASNGVYVTDAGGLAHGMPTGTLIPRDAGQIAAVLRRAQQFEVPVTTRGGGLTTEGESVAFGGLLLDMSGMSHVLKTDPQRMTVRTEAGIYWLQLAEHLRRDGLDYLSAPLNLTSSVGGTLGVGGIDINSPRLGCSADQAIALQVVTPTGDIVECSEKENPDLFERVLLGYGQFGIITEATLPIRPFTPISMWYFYYGSLERGIRDMQMLVREDAADYCGILTIMDRAINLLVAFDSDEREEQFAAKWRSRLSGHGEAGFALRVGGYYLTRPWKWREAAYLVDRRLKLFPAFRRREFMREGKIIDRAVLFSQAVWNFYGRQKMIIPDLATSEDKFVEAVVRGNQVCRKYFDNYTLYCVGIRTWPGRPRYEMSCIPPDATDFSYGCEFQPMLGERMYSRDYLQAYKNEIYDIGVEMKTSYYRFGGMMKSYIRRTLGDELVDRHLEMKRRADPAMILNRDVIF